MYFHSASGDLIFGPNGGILEVTERLRSFAHSIGQTAYLFPVIPGAQSIAFFIRGSGFTNGNGVSQFLFDNREGYNAYWYSSGFANLNLLRVNGDTAIFAASGLADLSGNVWRKVYLEAGLDSNFYLACRYSQTEFLVAHDMSEVTVYGRLWNGQETSDTTGYLPESGILAKYDFSQIFPDGQGNYFVPDTSGNGYHAKVVGALPTLFSA
jgi:hypothetical protein